MDLYVKNRIMQKPTATIIGDNADYTVNFHFDDEWGDVIKTARFERKNGEYADAVLVDDSCEIPVQVLKSGQLKVGVYSDKMTTTYTEIYVNASIKERSGVPKAPSFDVYQQILEKVSAIRKGDPGAAFTFDMFTAEQLESLRGPAGNNGNDGAKGEKGDPGEKGEKGEKGEPGEKGADGRNGRDGADGRNGIDGINGADGKTAYESAQEGGFLGTLNEFYEKLGKVIGIDEVKNIFNECINYVTPQMFGAKGDGKADDTEAIQNMFNTIKHGAIVYFPVGVYNISNTISLKKNVTIYGENSLHMWKNSSANILRNNSQINYVGTNENIPLFKQESTAYSISIKNMMFYGNAFEVVANTEEFTAVPYKYFNDVVKINGISAIEFASHTQIYCDSCAFVGFSGYGITLGGDHRYVKNCVFYFCNVGIEVTGTDCMIEHDWFCLCNTGIKVIDGAQNFALLKVSDIWLDQLSGNAIRSENTEFFVLIANSLWIDMVDYAGIHSECRMERSKIEGRISRCGMAMAGKAYSSLAQSERKYASAIYAKRITGSFIDIMIDRRVIGKGGNQNGICPTMGILTNDGLFTNNYLAIDCERAYAYPAGGITNTRISCSDMESISDASFNFIKSGILFRTSTPLDKVKPVSANAICIDTANKDVYISTAADKSAWVSLSDAIVQKVKATLETTQET